jgi:hypothetical protein
MDRSDSQDRETTRRYALTLGMLVVVVIALVVTICFKYPEKGTELCVSKTQSEIGVAPNWQMPINVYPSQSAQLSETSQGSWMVKKTPLQPTYDQSSSANSALRTWSLPMNAERLPSTNGWEQSARTPTQIVV